MEIGISRPPAPLYPTADVDGAVVAQQAEILGFESVFYGEHPIRPLGEPGVSVHADGVPFFQDTLVMLARASAMTKRIKLGSAVMLIPVHHPVLLAKQLASLDFYSGGRLIIGIGVGWSRLECETLGGHFDRRWAQTKESIKIMKQLWSGQTEPYTGEFFSVPSIEIYPRPLDPKGPPCLLGVGGLRDSQFEQQHISRSRQFRRIVDFADGWMPAFVGEDSIESGHLIVQQGRAALDACAEEVEQHAEEIQITVILRSSQIDGETKARRMVTGETIRRYEDAGADRVAISLPTVKSEAESRIALERIAQSVLD